MTALLRYIARLCCDDDEQQDEYFRPPPPRGTLVVESSPIPVVVESTHMSRPTTSTTITTLGTHNYQPIVMSSRSASEDETAHDEEDDNDDHHQDDCCCRGKCHPSTQNDHGLNEFFRKLRERWRRYDSMETFRRTPAVAKKEENLKAGLSPLRMASSYDGSLDIPTIALEEVVMPGSELQRQMARAVSLNLEAQDDECVICMEGFDPTNPRMPTLCGCGQNKTYFHLPCLYQWIEQSEECPSCRQKLRWEEF